MRSADSQAPNKTNKELDKDLAFTHIHRAVFLSMNMSPL